MKTRAKRLLYLVHRWLGILLCAFFAMWFISGVVMMYVGYPKLTEAERLQHLPALGDGAGLLAPSHALARAGVSGPLRELRLAAGLGGRPAYYVVPAAGAGTPAGRQEKTGRKPAPGSGTIVIDARTGARLGTVDAAQALASAAAFAAAFAGGTADGAVDGAVALRPLGIVAEDAFTHSRALDAHRPLHRVALGDAADTLVYVSSRTAEVVRDASGRERAWNYAGAWIHWLYPFRGNVFDAFWTDIVNWLSIAGIALALSGTVVGVLRWRARQPYRSGARTPYHGVMRWHHIGGLLFALVTITWIFSGLMSMNPWRVFDRGAPPLAMAALEGGAPVSGPDDAAPVTLLRTAGNGVRELRWTALLGKTVVQAWPAAGAPMLLDAGSGAEVTIDADALRTAARGLLHAPLRSIETLTQYDFHYYSRDTHTMTGGQARPLPVWRVVYADPAATWVYLDPRTGAVVARSDSGKRTSRWLFALLHSWDWLPLLAHRPLWDAVLIVLSLGGCLISLSGIVIGWRRLGKQWRRTAADDAPALSQARPG